MQTPIEQRLTIGLPELRRMGYFDRRRSGSLTWHVHGQERASVAILVCVDLSSPQNGGTLTIAYERNGLSLREVITMVHVRSNLGRGGGIWYLVCPATGKHCRTLISGRSGFVSRHAEGGLRYRAQLSSQKDRAGDAGLRAIRQKERTLESTLWLIKPHSKRSYGGRLTRPMLRFNKLTNLSKTLKKDA